MFAKIESKGAGVEATGQKRLSLTAIEVAWVAFVFSQIISETDAAHQT